MEILQRFVTMEGSLIIADNVAVLESVVPQGNVNATTGILYFRKICIQPTEAGKRLKKLMRKYLPPNA